MSFIFILFLVWFLLYNPTVYFYCLLFCFNFWIVSHTFCTTKNQIISWICTIFYTVVTSTKTYLFCLIKVNCSNFLCIFYFINCELRLPGFLKILDFNNIALDIDILLCFSFLHFLIWWICLNNSNIVFENKEFFTTKKQINSFIMEILTKWLDRKNSKDIFAWWSSFTKSHEAIRILRKFHLNSKINIWTSDKMSFIFSIVDVMNESFITDDKNWILSFGSNRRFFNFNRFWSNNWNFMIDLFHRPIKLHPDHCSIFHS